MRDDKPKPEPGFTNRLFRLDGKTAVVTGGAGRIGRALCTALADAGASVAVIDIDAAAAGLVAEDINRHDDWKADVFCADLADPFSLTDAAQAIEERFGPIGVLVNSAQYRGSGFYGSTPEDYPPKAWEAVIQTNLTAVLLACQAFGKAMIGSGGGSIVNISSTYGVVSADPRIYGESGVNSPISYAASKSGVLNLTRYLAIHWRDKQVRVNNLVPGGVFDNQDQKFVTAYCDRTPMGRMATVEDYQGAVLFMASDASSYMTGATVTVDGGWTAW